MTNNNRKLKSSQRKEQHQKDEELIQISNFDNSALIERFRLTLIGRSFHTGGRSTEALLIFMPRVGIWDIEGRVRGADLGHGRFHFDFNEEEDLLKVLKKRPCHFNKWTFSLERWVPSIREDFPSIITFLIKIRGIPLHYWIDSAFREIGEALGQVEAVDEKGGCVQVTIDASRPLSFEKKAKFFNGDDVSVTLEYERLYRYCLMCKMISHEEANCPDVGANRDQISMNRREDHVHESVHKERDLRREIPRDKTRTQATQTDLPRERRGTKERLQPEPKRLKSNSGRPTTKSEAAKDKDLQNRHVLGNLHLSEKYDRHEEGRGSVWQRIDKNKSSYHPRNREFSHQSSYGPRKRRLDESMATSSWKWKSISKHGDEMRKYEKRRRDSPPKNQRHKSLSVEAPRFEQWRDARPLRIRDREVEPPPDWDNPDESVDLELTAEPIGRSRQRLNGSRFL